ncbi:uncharacterized protein I206_105912 [Kwoniella pini CBS 10737]|uniref:Endoplasmic reticulum-based factor for assembly of V-ATPase n=1 Tax=Kwoniella pini CBS 10737 TaxID=1296096 RepID=A0A1B9I0Q6_9TREE|nr:uncharacterized protein I206_04735 [Kwoniella pini CBS 10737]OCF49048.1 hypothetical protein I206_04735 [Kwoniella pini CBS 10737]
MTTLLILPPHLLETIQDLLSEDVDLPKTLREELKRTTDQQQTNQPEQDVQDVTSREYENPIAQTKGESHSNQMILTEQPKPLTIPHETIEKLSRWAGLEGAKTQLIRKGLDPNKFTSISLLAGTEIYIPPNELERLKAAENPEKVNPFIPSYLNPNHKPPSIGSEYRKLSKTISTILNILFSIFGSSIAVYLVCKSSSGYSNEISLLLSILTGLIVGIADLILIYLYSDKLDKGRKESHKIGLKMLRGTGALQDNEEQSPIQDEDEKEDNTIVDLEAKEITQSTGRKVDIRLRRRGLKSEI